MKCYKILSSNNRSCHGGTGRWTPGKWRYVKGPIAPCHHALHFARLEDLGRWVGARIWEAECSDDAFVHDDCKLVARRGRIVKECEHWTPENMLKLAAWACRVAAAFCTKAGTKEAVAKALDAVDRMIAGAISDDELDQARKTISEQRLARGVTYTPDYYVCVVLGSTLQRGCQPHYRLFGALNYLYDAAASSKVVRPYAYASLNRFMHKLVDDAVAQLVTTGTIPEAPSIASIRHRVYRMAGK